MATQRQQRRAADRADLARDRAARLRQRVVLATTSVAVGFLGWAGFQWLGPSPPVREGAPSWSPDSARIAFYAEQPNGKADLFVMRADGTDRQPIFSTDDADEGGPAFSPDGHRIAYDTDRDGNFEIYVVDLATRAPRRLTTHPARDVSAAWSPDGRKIAFMSDRATRNGFDLFWMNADGTALEQLTTDGKDFFPQFSPDGTQIAFHRGRDVHILDVATRAIWRLTTEPADGMHPSWSPDGAEIAFMSARNGRTEIFIMDAFGQNPRVRVSATGSAIDPRWSPDGTRLAYVQVPESRADAAQDPAASRAIYVVEVASGRVTRLSR